MHYASYNSIILDDGGNGLKKNIYRMFIELTNNKFLSYLLMHFARSRWSKIIIPLYSKVYQLEWKDVEKDKTDFQSLHELFTRELKAGVRPICSHENSVVSPVDAVLENYGTITEDKNILVKGKTYSIEEMLGNEKVLPKYINGHFLILYLSPSHYHRIHAPINCEVQSRWTLGSKSYPVNQLGLKYGKEILSKNYRVISELKHTGGYMALVKVGAMFVNSIELTNLQEQLKKGEEMAYFSFGSTVVLLFEKDTFCLADEVQLGSEVKHGEKLGYIRDIAD